MTEVLIQPVAAAVAIIIVGAVVLIIQRALDKRKRPLKQKRAMFEFDESVELSRRNVKLQEQANLLMEELVRGQEEMLQLLRALARQSAVDEMPEAIREGESRE